MSEQWEVTISNDTDSSSGVYDTKGQAMDAVDEAASVDGLTARYGVHGKIGFLVDAAGNAVFGFTIKHVEKPDEYVLLALDCGETQTVVGWNRLVWFAHDRGCHVDGALIRDNLTGQALYSTALFQHEKGN